MANDRALFQLKSKARQDPESAYELGIYYASIDGHSQWDLIMAASLFWWAIQQNKKYEQRLSDWLSTKGQLKTTIERLLNAPLEWNKVFRVAMLTEPTEADIEKREELFAQALEITTTDQTKQSGYESSSPSPNLPSFSPSMFVGSVVGTLAFSTSSHSKGYHRLPTTEKVPARPTSPTKGVAERHSISLLPPPPPPKSYDKELKFFTDKIAALEFNLHGGWGKTIKIKGKAKKVSTAAAEIYNLIDNQPSFNESKYKEALGKITKILAYKRDTEDCYDNKKCCNFFRKRDIKTTELYREFHRKIAELNKPFTISQKPVK